MAQAFTANGSRRHVRIDFFLFDKIIEKIEIIIEKIRSKILIKCIINTLLQMVAIYKKSSKPERTLTCGREDY